MCAWAWALQHSAQWTTEHWQNAWIKCRKYLTSKCVLCDARMQSEYEMKRMNSYVRCECEKANTACMKMRTMQSVDSEKCTLDGRYLALNWVS